MNGSPAGAPWSIRSSRAAVSIWASTRSASVSSFRSLSCANVDVTWFERPPGRRGDLAEQRPPEPVALEDAVPRGAKHRPGGAAAGERLAAVRGDHAVVDLVPGDRLAARGLLAEPEHLRGAERDRGRQQAKPRGQARAALHVVADLGGEHLVAAADAEHRAAPRGAIYYGAGQPVLAQPGQVGHGGPAAGQDHQVGVGDLRGGGDEPERHARLGRQRVGVGEVADPGQPDHRDPEHVAGRGWKAARPARRPG